jgi:hypothetical protein
MRSLACRLAVGEINYVMTHEVVVSNVPLNILFDLASHHLSIGIAYHALHILGC